MPIRVPLRKNTEFIPANFNKPYGRENPYIVHDQLSHYVI